MVFRLDEHLRRFTESCEAIGKSLPEPLLGLRIWLLAALAESGLKDALLRFSAHWQPDGREGRLAVIIRPFVSHPAQWHEKGVSLKTAVARRWTLKAQDPQIKASQFMNGVLAAIDERASDAHELIFLGPAQTVAEGSVSNIFIVSRKRLLTPSRSEEHTS